MTYSSSSKSATGKQNSGSGKNVSFAHLDQSASGDDEGIEESEDDQYVPSNSSKKRSHEEMEKERRVPRNAPLRRSRTANIDSPSPNPPKVCALRSRHLRSPISIGGSRRTEDEVAQEALKAQALFLLVPKRKLDDLTFDPFKIRYREMLIKTPPSNSHCWPLSHCSS
ncbi:hypothetical protein SCHPADRAFT_133872 [Schizopora paradoxa]|uniref:Uncharacterized protein n=1 Tax=Schizopora paradoxa TaxID=27342 RepID=A0A0H2SLS5_9AGAM|nr:hypothetical protein SCHPADRAFT_133872 [Schizopora paradoxa]